MTDTIVVGVTGAEVTDRAVDWAVQRAAHRGGRVELLGVVGGAIGVVGEGAILQAALEATQELLELQVARAGASGVEVRTRVAVGDPVAQLIEASHDATLLVIGSDYRGAGGPARGAHGIRVVAGAACPVVVVPDAELGERSGVVVGVDGSVVSSTAIAFAAAEADRLGEPLIAVCAWTPVMSARHSPLVYPDEYREGMTRAAEESLRAGLHEVRARYPQLVVDEQVHEGYPSTIINELAATARLTVLGSHGRGAVRRFLLGSISHEVLQRLATVTAIVR